MKPCYKCNSNKWKYLFDDNTRWVTAICQKCGNEIQFPAKKKKFNPNKEHVWGEYKNVDGRTYLRTNKNPEFIEVGLFKGYDNKGRWYMQVVPINKANYKTI